MTIAFAAPGSDEYDRATSPHNSSGAQRPAAVAHAASTDDVVAAIREASRRGLTVLPQATGHGAGGTVGDDTVILDTSGLASLAIDPDTRVATAGAGLTWSQVNSAAEGHGLLGLAGSSPTVCISGYTFGGGIGFLSRPHGMASSALRAVEYVTGDGTVRRAADDADDELDREAIFAFRGGGGVGVATTLEFDLFPVADLHAGYLLWPVARLAEIAAAWAKALPDVSDDVATSLGVLHVPPAPPFPASLRGTSVVHLAVAASNGIAGAEPLLAAVRAAADPAVDDWGRADSSKLAQIHLDPPTAIPALGDARWLTDAAPGHAAELLGHAAADDSAIVMLEIRSIGDGPQSRSGACTSVVGPFVSHAVAPLTDAQARPAIDDAFARLKHATDPVDAGYSVGSWVEGAVAVPDALPVDVRSRVAAAADAVDPAGRIRRSRFLA